MSTVILIYGGVKNLVYVVMLDYGKRTRSANGRMLGVGVIQPRAAETQKIFDVGTRPVAQRLETVPLDGKVYDERLAKAGVLSGNFWLTT